MRDRENTAKVLGGIIANSPTITAKSGNMNFGSKADMIAPTTKTNIRRANENKDRAKQRRRKNKGSFFMRVEYSNRSAVRDGTISAISPQPKPARKAAAVPFAIMKDIAAPTAEYNTEAIRIVRVDGKATRRMKL